MVKHVCVPNREALTQFALLNYQQDRAVEQKEDMVEVGNRDASGIRFTPLVEAHVFSPSSQDPNQCSCCHGTKDFAEAYHGVDALKWERHKQRVLNR